MRLDEVAARCAACAREDEIVRPSGRHGVHLVPLGDRGAVRVPDLPGGSRGDFALGVEKGLIKGLKMQRWIQNPKIPFMNFTKPTSVLSAVLIVLGFAVFLMLGDKKYGLDFLGGGTGGIGTNWRT